MDDTRGEQLKNLGNAEYKEKNYNAAIKHYSDAISVCPGVPSYYGNRAATLMMIGDYKNALRDSKKSLVTICHYLTCMYLNNIIFFILIHTGTGCHL